MVTTIPDLLQTLQPESFIRLTKKILNSVISFKFSNNYLCSWHEIWHDQFNPFIHNVEKWPNLV